MGQTGRRSIPGSGNLPARSSFQQQIPAVAAESFDLWQKSSSNRLFRAATRKLFLQYPWKQYAGDPIWIPPLRGYQKEQVGYTKNPFYDRNEIQTFLALRNGEVCGRIAAILNVGHNEYHKENLGFWGFFESIDDQEVADALFAAVRGWFAERGIRHLRGPANPSLNSEVGAAH